jgi:hypothetical protein
MHPLQILSLTQVLVSANAAKNRVRIQSVKHNHLTIDDGYVRLTGELKQTAEKGNLEGFSEESFKVAWIYLHFRKTDWGEYQGWEMVYLKDIVEITSTIKHRRTGQYPRIWKRNPLAITGDGAIDMATSLKLLLGVT